MRTNEPITAVEVDFADSDVLVSRTDAGGRIVFANEIFTRISGFTPDELLGAPHNIVRHPHMPQAAFADLWATIKAGRPWDGLVKNRSKSGGYYWVRANVTPVVDGGQVTGYISIRSRPTAAQKSLAESIYGAMRDGRRTGYGLRDGELVRVGWRAGLRDLRDSIAMRVAAAVAIPVLGMIALGGMAHGGIVQAGMGTQAALAVGVAVGAALAGLSAVASLRRHVRGLEDQFEAIAAKRLADNAAPPSAREFRRVTSLLRMLRARMAFTEAERAEADLAAATERRDVIGALAARVETESVAAVSSVAGRTDLIAEEAQAMASIAGTLSGRAGGMASASTDARDAVEAVAAASEELAASIREITTQAARAGEITRRAVAGGHTAAETIGRLSETVGRIGEVVHLIRAVAGQTNLLALNATIEAARAGEAGKGFAVVAGEVKGLAGQTARSTEDISRHIAEVQASTEAVVQAVSGIGAMITDIAEAAGAIAAAMEEQATVTQEIARNVAQSGIAVRRMSDEAEAVSSAAQEAGTRAEGVSAQTAAVHGEVAALQGTLTDVVRSSIGEADRRTAERFAVSEACAAEFGGGRKDGRLVDVSQHGALVSGIAGARVGDELVLVLTERAGLRRRCQVRSLNAHGLLLDIIEADADRAWHDAIAAMRGPGARRAA
jgi:aerotaxis receptor